MRPFRSRFRPRLKTPFRARFRTRFPVLPTLITLGNGTCGLVSIAVLTTARPQLGDPAAAFYAGALIYLGMLFDGIDGYVARATNQTSEFGIQLDSLCDAITFGVAPVFIMLNLSAGFYLRFLWSIGVMFALCVLLRLARYNVDTHDHDDHGYFRGLPSPAAAGTVASFAIAMPTLRQGTDASLPGMVQWWSQLGVDLVETGTPIVTLVLAGLMVSRIRYPHVLSQWLNGRRNFYKLAQVMFVVVVLATIHELALPLLFSLFAFGYPLIALWNRSLRPSARPVPTQPDVPASDTLPPASQENTDFREGD